MTNDPPIVESGIAELAIDPAEPGFFLRPDYYEVLARLRRDAPVYEFAPGVKAITRYHDIREISRNPAVFCSGRGVLANDPIREGGTIPGSILHMDPPQHNQWRRILNRQFTTRALAGMEAKVRRQVAQLLDALPRGEEIDLVDHLSAPLPVLVICDLLGVPDSDRSDFRRWSDAAIVATDGLSVLPPEEEVALMEMAGFLDQLAKHKRTEPADDIVSLLVNADVEGRKPTSAELITFNMSLVVAGNETTRHLISGSLMELSAMPDAWATMASDQSLVAGAVEECLRWVTPIQQFARTTTADTALGEGDDAVAIDEGDYLVMLYASGNRDEAAFGPTADTFDPRRDPGVMNLAFGFGEHLCLGAALARLEARVLFEEMGVRNMHFEQTGDAEYLPSSLVRGAHSVPFVFA